MELKKMKFIDLFAGIGGFRYALESFGCKCVFSSEWDKYCQESYNLNFGEIPYGDITKIDEKDIPSFDILCAGFPCQPFSISGKQKGFEDTRGTLFFDIVRIVSYHKPKIIFLENVKNLKAHNGGATFEVISNTLDSLNYNIYYKVLNAKDFGVPQNRERIIIVGFKNHDVDFKFPEPIKNNKMKLGDILEKDVDDKYTISDKIWASHQRRKEQHKAKGNGFGYSLFNEESPYTSTISARYYKDGSEILIEQKGKNPRRLTPREAARLQGFPDDFKLVVSDMQLYKQFGNSVPTKMIGAVADEIYKALVESGEI